MNGYEFFIVDKSNSLRILFASSNVGKEESLLSLFTPAQTGKVYELVSSSGGICPCADEAYRVAIFTSTVDPVAFAVRFECNGADVMQESITACTDAVIRQLSSAFDRAGHIANTFSLFPEASLIDANMLLSEFMRTRTVESNRKAASFGFAVVNAERLVKLLISHIVFLHFLLNEQDDLYVEISNCGGIFRATVYFSEEYLEVLVFAFPRVCGEENVVIRSCDGGFAVEVIAAVEDNSKIGLKSNVD